MATNCSARYLIMNVQKLSYDSAEDILQDVFLKIHSKIDTLQESAKLESWIYQITRNSIIDYYRSEKPMIELPDWIEESETKDSKSIRHELSSCLIPLIEQLPEKYQVAIRHSEIDGKSQKELAKLENISISGAKSRVQRGRSILKSMLHDCCLVEINQNRQLGSFEPKKPNCNLCEC